MVEALLHPESQLGVLLVRLGADRQPAAAIGAVEVGSAAAAVVGRVNPMARTVAAIGTLATMGGAMATPTMSGEPKDNLVSALSPVGLAAASRYDLDVIIRR